MNKEQKIGRNEPCPCGSGKKFKKCHGATKPTVPLPPSPLSDPELKRQFQLVEGTQIQREKQQGLGRPIVSSVLKGYRFVAVGSRFYYSKDWNTFHDFLFEYIKIILGREWGVLEQKKNLSDRHPILQWLHQIGEYRRKVLEKSANDITSSPMTGAVFAYLTLSYNLYLLAHNVEIQERLINRLRNRSLFYGAFYETIVASSFIKAGFQLRLEDEYDGSGNHCEFVAVSNKTSQRYSVEAKTRRPQKVDFSIRNQLHKALKKKASSNRVIFIDLNVSKNFDDTNTRLLWLQEVIRELRSCETSLTVHRNPAPNAYVFVTNHPFTQNLDSFDYAPGAVAEGFKIPDFKVDSEFSNLREALNSRDKHIDMLDLIKAMREFDQIPCTFDGEIPEYAFGDIKNPRLIIGGKYLVPDKTGNEVPAELIECGVWEEEKKACGIYKLSDGKHIIMSHELSDLELQVYRRNRDTFFGVHKKHGGEVKDALDLYDFFYRLYRKTSKENLLEFLKDHPEFHEFKEMTQEELAKTYCEILVYSIIGKTRGKLRIVTNGGPLRGKDV